MTQRQEKLGGTALRQKVQKQRRERVRNTFGIYCLHFGLIGVAVTSLVFGNWIIGAAFALLWLALILSF
jgi:hypothetical protein